MTLTGFSSFVRGVLPVPKGFEYKITAVEKKEGATDDAFDTVFSSGTDSFEFGFFPDNMNDRKLSLMLQIESLLLTVQEGSFHPTQPPFVDS